MLRRLHSTPANGWQKGVPEGKPGQNLLASAPVHGPGWNRHPPGALRSGSNGCLHRRHVLQMEGVGEAAAALVPAPPTLTSPSAAPRGPEAARAVARRPPHATAPQSARAAPAQYAPHRW
eukprot:EG_transcript_34283